MSETRELYRANDGVSTETLSKIILKGDWKDLTPAQRVEGYIALCRSLGLNPLAKPFDLLEMRDRTTLYLNSAGGAQLGAIHGASYTITRVESELLTDSVMVVRAYVKVRLPDGRENEDMGMKHCNPKDVNDYIRAHKSAITNGRLRAIKGLIGLNVLVEGDEDEIPNARVVNVEVVEPEPAPQPRPARNRRQAQVNGDAEKHALVEQVGALWKQLYPADDESTREAFRIVLEQRYNARRLSDLTVAQLQEFKAQLEADQSGESLAP